MYQKVRVLYQRDHHQEMTSFSVLFWLNKSRSKNNKPAIYLRLSLGGKRAELSTYQYVPLYYGMRPLNPQKEVPKKHKRLTDSW